MTGGGDVAAGGMRRHDDPAIVAGVLRARWLRRSSRLDGVARTVAGGGVGAAGDRRRRGGGAGGMAAGAPWRCCARCARSEAEHLAQNLLFLPECATPRKLLLACACFTGRCPCRPGPADLYAVSPALRGLLKIRTC